MNLTSCDNCAVVLDKDKLDFPTDINDGDGVVDDEKAVWSGDDYVPYVPCPVCKEPVKQRD